MIAMQDPYVPAGEADPRLKLSLDLATRHRDIQLATLTHLRDRSLALLEIVFLGAAIVFSFGSSRNGSLTVWMVVLLLVALAYCMAAVYFISLPSKWQTTDWRIPRNGRQAKCSCASHTVNECMKELLDDVDAGMAKNDVVLHRKRRAFVSMFWMLATLIVLAVVFWMTLGVS